MSTKHITITEAFLRSDQILDRELDIKNDGDNRLAIHAPAIRGIYLPLRVTYHEGDRSPTNRSTTFVEQTKTFPTVFEFDLPRWVRRITIEAPPIPAGAQVFEGEPVVFPGRAEVDGTAASDPELARRTTTAEVDSYSGEPGRETRFGDVCGDVIPEQGFIATMRGEVAEFDQRAVLVKDGAAHRLVSIDESDVEAKIPALEQHLRDKGATQWPPVSLHDIEAKRNKAMWRDLAIERGKRLDDRNAERQTILGTIGGIRQRALDLGAAARTLHDRLGERSDAMRAAQRDAAMLERRVAELTNRDKQRAGEIVEQSAEVDRLNEALEASGEQVRHLAQRERRATDLFQTEHAQVKELTERNERQGETIVKQAQERDDARALNTANARRIEDMTAQIASLTNALADDRESKHQEQEARQTAEQNVREATDALEQMQEQRDEARAERDNAQAEHAQALADHDVTRNELAQARDAIDTLGSRPAITNDVAEALNGILRLVEHEGGNADGVSLVEALRLAEQQWEAAREAQANSRRGWRDADHVLEKIDRVLPDIRGVDDLVQRAEKLAVWCRERDRLKAALAMSDQTITERDATIERMRERHEHDGRLNAAMRSELGNLRREPFVRHTNSPCSLIPWSTDRGTTTFDVPPHAGSVEVGFDASGPFVEFKTGAKRPIAWPRQVGKSAENAPGPIHLGIDYGLKLNGGQTPAEILAADLAPMLRRQTRQIVDRGEDEILRAAGITRRTHQKTIHNLRRARHQRNELRATLRRTIGELRNVTDALKNADD